MPEGCQLQQAADRASASSLCCCCCCAADIALMLPFSLEVFDSAAASGAPYCGRAKNGTARVANGTPRCCYCWPDGDDEASLGRH